MALHALGKPCAPQQGCHPSSIWDEVDASHPRPRSVAGPDGVWYGVGHQFSHARGPAGQIPGQPAEVLEKVVDRFLQPEAVSVSVDMSKRFLERAEESSHSGRSDGHGAKFS